MEETILVMTNLPDLPSADTLARYLVEQRLAACVNRLSPVHSVYRWQGSIEEAGEVTLLIKTTQARYPELEQALKQHHPYELPEIIAIPVVAGLPAYVAWAGAETRKEIRA